MNQQTMIKGNDLVTQDSTILTQHKAYRGLALIWNNPPIQYNGSPIPTSMRAQRYVTDDNAPAPLTITSDTDTDIQIRAADIQKVVFDLKTVGAEIYSLTGSNPQHNNAPNILKGDLVTAAHINSIQTIINNIQSALNNYNSYWDGNNLCQRSCQVNCQIGCQVSCQSCVTSQCHNQNCGLS